MIPNEVQSVLRIEPPYGTRLVQHLHHAELLFAKKDARAVIDWIQNLNMQAISVLIQQDMLSKTVECTNCQGGYIVDSSRVTDVFPNGVPVKCHVCNGTTLIDKQSEKPNDINSDTIRPVAFPVVHVEKDTE